MGLTNFSMHPTSMLTVKKQVLSSDPKKEIKIKANKILRSIEPDNIESLIQDINK